MLIDKERFEKLKEERGGALKFECATVAKILEAPDLKKIDTCNARIYPNGLYLSFLWRYKLYFPITDFKEVIYDNNIIEIHLTNDEIVKMQISNEKDLKKFDSVLKHYLSDSVGHLDLEGIKQAKAEIRKQKMQSLKEEYRAKNLKEMEKKQQEKARVEKMDSEGIAYCPKCHSTSLSAHKKGFGIGKALLGATINPIGLVAGNIGAKKVRVTCLKCGHQFWAGKK